MLLFYDGISLRSFNNWLNKLSRPVGLSHIAQRYSKIPQISWFR